MDLWDLKDLKVCCVVFVNIEKEVLGSINTGENSRPFRGRIVKNFERTVLV